MNRWLPAIAVGLALGAAVLVVVASLGSAGGRTASERANALAAELRCPDCQGLAVADSPTASAVEIRRQIGELVAGGASDEEVRRHFVDRYGQWILLAPSGPAAWLLPFAVVIAGGVALLAWLRHGDADVAGRRRPVDPEERRRLREEVEAIDA